MTGRGTGAAALAALLMLGSCSSNDAKDGASLGTGPPRTATTAPLPTSPSEPSAATGALITAAGVVVPVTSASGDERVVITPCGRPATLTGGAFVARATVVLDPGHGGADPGAVSPAGLSESGVNLAVSNYAKDALERAGVSVLLTRTGDYDMNLGPRADLAKAVGASAFVSIHHNAEPDSAWPRPGSETYYQIGSANSKRLAGLVYEEVVKALTPYPVTWVADTDAGAKYRPGNRGDYYAVLRLPTPVVSVLAELAFISNPPEAALIARADVQRVEGEAVARGILRYFRSSDPGSGFTEPYPRPGPPPRPPGAPPLPPPTCTDPAL